MSHFLLRCPELEKDRKPYLQQLSNTVHRYGLRGPQDGEEAVKLILDPSHFASDEDIQLEILSIARNLCFKLHHRRSIATGRGSAYKSRGKTDQS